VLETKKKKANWAKKKGHEVQPQETLEMTRENDYVIAHYEEENLEVGAAK